MNEHEMNQRNDEERERTVTSRRRFLLGLVAAGLAYTGPQLLGLDEAEAAPRSRRTRPSRRGRGPSRPSRRGRGPSRPSRRGRGPSRRNHGRGPSRPGRPGPSRSGRPGPSRPGRPGPGARPSRREPRHT